HADLRQLRGGTAEPDDARVDLRVVEGGELAERARVVFPRGERDVELAPEGLHLRRRATLVHPPEGLGDRGELVLDEKLLLEGCVTSLASHAECGDAALEARSMCGRRRVAGTHLQDPQLLLEVVASHRLERDPRAPMRDREAYVDLE